ncbi:hypothetical protein V492_04830 [Pseudogymnoascus sp. VKM F-4246]|nr:hypothetical protein V492_04830 [Pseudogymnoascus sp. VKM F-4246]
MSYAQYDQYGGNPHGGSTPGYDVAPSDPYAQGESTELRNMSAGPQGQSVAGGTYVQPRTQREFLDQVAAIRDLLRGFDTSMVEVSQYHQRLLDATDTAAAADLGPGLQQLESETLSRNDQLKRLIKNLEQDAANTADDTKNMKFTQIAPLKKEFQSKLTKYQGVERDYRTRRQEQIRRQYLIVNPDATDTELAAVADSSNDPGSQNVFQMALTNRRGQAQSALGAVKARHDELQRIERTITELAALFNEMDQLVVAQEPLVERTEANAEQATTDLESGNKQVDKAIGHAKNRNKLKWWCFFICVLIVLAIALGVGLGVGLANVGKNKAQQATQH